MTDPAVVTLTEAAQILGIGRRTAYRLEQTGDFPVPVLTIGGRKKVSRRQLAAFIDGDLAEGSAA